MGSVRSRLCEKSRGNSIKIRFNSPRVSRALLYGTFSRNSLDNGLLVDNLMATPRVRRTWWMMSQSAHEAPLFRELARRWRPVDRRERRIAPFQLALSPSDPAPPTRKSFGPKRVQTIVEKVKKSARTWNPWMMMK